MKSHVNPVVALTPEEVAELFSFDVLRGPYFDRAILIIQHIRAGRYDQMKKDLKALEALECEGPTFFAIRQFAAFIKKVPFPGGIETRRDAALSTFHKGEKLCRIANKRLRFYNTGLNRNRLSDTLRVVMHRAQLEVRRILGGDLTDGRLRAVIELARPSGGIAEGTWNKYRTALPYKLMDTDLVCSTRAIPYARMLLADCPLWSLVRSNVDWSNQQFHVSLMAQDHNRVSFVPKDALTLRTIAIEPNLNMWLQLGVHEYLAKRLDITGNSIRDQSRNQGLALVGSLTGELATLDLSNASSSMCRELVRWLYPPGWYGLLDDLRSSSGVVEGATVTYEMMSSMGNGYTFAVETIVFLAIARACSSLTEGAVSPSVYGDDIIVSRSAYALTVEVLRFCGFTVNTDKSYCFGPFRESCGADWLQGHQVTPVYIRSAKLRVTDCYRLLNTLDPIFPLSRLKGRLLKSIKDAHGKIYHGYPSTETTGHLFSTHKYLEGSGQLKWNSRYHEWRHLSIRFKPKREALPPWHGYLSALFKSGGSDPFGFGGAMGSEFGDLRKIGRYRSVMVPQGLGPDLPRFSVRRGV